MNYGRLTILALVTASGLLVGACNKATFGVPPAPTTALVEKQTGRQPVLFFVDSVEVADIKQAKLDPSNIKAIHVLGVAHKEELVRTYGQRAKNGVVFVTTKTGK